MKDLLDALIVQMVDNDIFYTDAVDEFEKRFIKKVLDKNHGNQSKAAQALGIHRNTAQTPEASEPLSPFTTTNRNTASPPRKPQRRPR